MYKQKARHKYKAVDLSGVPVYGVDAVLLKGIQFIIDQNVKYTNMVMVKYGSVTKIRTHPKGISL